MGGKQRKSQRLGEDVSENVFGDTARLVCPSRSKRGHG